MNLFEAEPAEGGSVKKWLFGYLIPCVILVYATWAVIKGEIHLPHRSGKDFTGTPARCLAITYLSIAIWHHFHWGWGLSHQLWPDSGRGKIAAWCLGVPATLLFIYFAFTQSS